MRKKKAARILGLVLAAAVFVTSAPGTALAAVSADTGKGEQAVTPSEEGPAVPAETVKERDARAARTLAEGSLDDWYQDPATVIGNDSVNELYYMENGTFRHIAAGVGNGNSHSSAASYPAMFVHPDTFDFTQAGFFDCTIWTPQAASSVRFGIMLGYDGPENGMFFGYDSGGWYWQKYRGGDGNYFSGTRVAAPGAQVYTNVHIEWTDDYRATLTVQEAADYLGSASADPVEVFRDEDFSGIADALGDRIALKCGAYGGAATDMYLINVHYTGQSEAGAYRVEGTVTDEQGSPVEGATVELAGASGRTDADGRIVLSLNTTPGVKTVTVRKAGYENAVTEVEIGEDESVTAYFTAVLVRREEIASVVLSSDEMDVTVGETFPFVLRYDMKKDLLGKTLYGQTEQIDTVEINGTPIRVTADNLRTDFTEETATYEMTLQDEDANIDCVITAQLLVEGNTLTFAVTDVTNHRTERDENGYEVYPVQTIEIPNHSLVSVQSSQENANLKGAKVSSDTLTSGDKAYDVTDNMNFNSEDFMYAFVSDSELSAGLWSNSEYQGTHVAAYVSAGGASNTRVMATKTDLGGESSVGLASTRWYYDRKVTPTVNGTTRTYVVEHDEMPTAKVAVAGDCNDDGAVDWQDGAIAFRDIMHNPYKSEEVPDLVNYRIAMDFGSQAANPFLTILDGVKRVYLNTDGLGQGVLLKGYASEGHDSGHPDYGNIGTRIGGAQDMNTLMEEGAQMGAKFGVHINASEMYTEAKAFSDELSRGNYGWNWLDQGIGINGLYDLASGERLSRLQDLKDQVGDNLDFIYLDVWGNQTSGSEDAWESRNIARQINSFGWRFTTEWGATGEYDSTLQHWAADLNYGGSAAKGQNSEVMRFLRNHQKDSWIADYSSYKGAAEAPLLGGLEMTDFEGWSGRTDYSNYITVMFRHNLITKFLQHYKVMKWVDGDAVTMNGKSWTPEMEITLEDEAHQVVATRDSNDYSDLSAFRSRTITYDGTVVSKGARTSGDGTEGNAFVGDESYLIPWFWDADGSDLAESDQKLYHWNTKGGETTWELIDEWKDLASVVVYRLSDQGKSEETTVPVVDGTITLTAEAETPYVVYRGEKAQLSVDWQSSRYIYDMGFNDPIVTDNRTVTGTGTAAIVDNASQNHMLKLDGAVSVEMPLKNLTPGQTYAAYIGVDNRSDAKAYMTVTSKDVVLGNNYTERSFVNNMVSSDQHHMGSGATVAGNNSSYFQNMYVFFTAPESGDATLTLRREAGSGSTYFDDVRIVETEMDVVRETDEDGIITALSNDFEHNAQGIWPFVICGPCNGYAGWVTDNRIHLSEANGIYTCAGYKDKRVDDVLDGSWSVKINGLTQSDSMIYQTIPQNFHFEPGETYYVSFDYQMGSEGTYQVCVGDGASAYYEYEEAYTMPAAVGETKSYGFTFTASESGQSWFGIYSTDTAADLHGMTSSGAQNFSGYKDFILDNLMIRKAGMLLSETSVTCTSAQEPIALHVTFTDPADEGRKVTWASSDESVACVNQDGLVRFTGYGTAMITATARFDGYDVTLCCAVTLPREYENTATFLGAWANTQETAGESAGAANVTDRNASTIWHSEWYNRMFTVSESNPAIITVKTLEDVTQFENRKLRQREGSNGLVQRYELVIGETFDSSSHTITDGVSTGIVEAANKTSGSVEDLSFPEGAFGHYLQIRVVQGSNNYASIADILLDTVESYETPLEDSFLLRNRIDVLFEEKEEAKAAGNEQRTSEINVELRELLTELVALQEEIKAEYEAVLADGSASAEEKAAAQEGLDAIETALQDSTVCLDAVRSVVLADQLVAAAEEAYDAVMADESATQEQIEEAAEELEAAKTLRDGCEKYLETLWKLMQTLRELEAAQRENLSLKEQLTLKEAEIARAQADLEAAKARADELEDLLEDLREQISALESGNEELTAQCAETERLLAEARADVDTANEALERLQGEKSDLETQLRQLQDEKDAAGEEADRLLAEKQKELEAAKLEAEQARKEKEQLEKDLADTLRKLEGQTARTDALQKGDKTTYKNVTYTVLDPKKKTAAVTGGANVSSLVIAGSVAIKGTTCTVTQIRAKAFRNAKKLRKITIGANIRKIGAKAFWNAGKLKTVKIKTTKLKTVGKKAFGGISPKAKISVPKSRKTAYRKLLNKKIPAGAVVK